MKLSRLPLLYEPQNRGEDYIIYCRNRVLLAPCIFTGARCIWLVKRPVNHSDFS